MSDDAERDSERDDRVDEEMARADRANGEGSPADGDRSPARGSDGLDPDAPGGYVDDEGAGGVVEPNEPA